MRHIGWLALLFAVPLAAQQPDSVKRFPVTRPVTTDSVVVWRTRVVHDTVTPPQDSVPTPPPDTVPTPPPPPATHKGLQVAPGGTSSGDGSASKPLSLAAAFAGAGGAVDTIWLRGGTYPTQTYRCTTPGTASRPRIFRQWPGERAIVRNRIEVNCAHTWLWGFEIANTVTTQQDLMGVDVHAAGVRLINLVIHDQSGNGIGMWVDAPDAEATGNILYNNGFCGSSGTPPTNCSSFGHGIYAQNNTGKKLLQDNLLLQTFGYGLHVYTEQQYLRNFTIDGNVAVNNGSGSGGNNFLVGGSTPVTGCVFTHNLAYASPGRNASTWIGRSSAQNVDCVVRGNAMVYGGPAFRFFRWTTLTVDSNRIVAAGGPGSLLDQQGGIANWTRNEIWGSASTNEVTKDGAGMTYAKWKQVTGLGASDSYTSGAPTGQWVYVRPNVYEKGRAHVVVYNWSGASTAKVDLSGVLKSGQAFEVRNAQRWQDAPVLTGSYSGPVTLPLAAVTPYPSIVGTSRQGTGTQFAVFVVLPR